jgi:DNA-binding MarR family transcriptional regulator
LEPRSITRLLKSLEEKKLIVRANDKQDKRSVRIHLTKEGKKHRENAREAVVRFNQVVQEEVGMDKLASCIEVLEKVNKIVERNNIYSDVTMS